MAYEYMSQLETYTHKIDYVCIRNYPDMQSLYKQFNWIKITSNQIDIDTGNQVNQIGTKYANQVKIFLYKNKVSQVLP